MAMTLNDKLVVAISSRALFDFEEENRLFEDSDPASYLRLQRERLNVPAAPGVAFSLVKKLLAFNTEAQQHVEVVLLSRNDPVSGMRVFRSAQAHGLHSIQRGVFTQGRDPFGYLRPLGAQLFLSANADDVTQALQLGYPAAHVFTDSMRASSSHPREVRIAFDGDAVLFSDEAERIFQARAWRLSSSMSWRKPPSHCPKARSSRCWPPCTGCSRPMWPACACARPWSRRAAPRPMNAR